MEQVTLLGYLPPVATARFNERSIDCPSKAPLLGAGGALEPSFGQMKADVNATAPEFS
jgi:hypothetical protein